ncbi:MAG: AAA family ATPase, partial [candidate division WOR-3 bacterium]
MTCPKCGSSNPEGAKFCNQCGAELREIVYRKKGREQRRRVAVMFADISGFTALSETLDPEEVKGLIDRCLKRLSGAIYKYEGYIDKFIGDCIMALFGAPVAHEDDPLRAAISAIDLMREIENFNKENRTNLALSIGINYGMVATGDLGRPGEYTVMGDTVNLAQRLQHAAPRGKIYVSESIVAQTRGEIIYKKLKAIKVKGKAEKVLVFEPQKVKRTYSLRRIKELRLIGRQQELKKLSDVLSKVKSCHGQVISVIGEAGIGKSKLLYEWKKCLADDIYLLEGKGLEYLKTSPYLVLKDVLRALFGIDKNDAQAVASAKLMHFIKEMHDSSLKKAVPFLKYFLSMALSVDDYNRFESMKAKDRVRMINEAILSLFFKVAETKPMVIVFEDCHWIDSKTIDLMYRFVEEITDKPIMIVNLYRPEFNIGKTSRLSYFSRIHLKPLSADDTITLLHDLFRCKKIEPRLVTLLLEKSGRIPFYIHELATNLF